MTPEELKEFREWCRTFEVPADSMIMKALEHIDQQATALDEAEALTKRNAELMNGYLAKITELESQLAEYRKPVESMDTDQLSQWNVELSTLLCMPVSDRENLWWQIAVGDHLDKFAKSWHSSRITELESQIIHQTAISACRIEERERLRAQVAALQEIAIGESERRHISDMSRFGFVLDSEFCPDPRKLAIDQLSEEHPEAFR